MSAQNTGIEIRNGPIWTWLTVTTFDGERETSPQVTRRMVDFVDSEVKDIVTTESINERITFAGELNDFDVFTYEESDILIESFIRHSEDFISIRPLNEVIDVFQDRINAHESLTVRDYRVVSEEFVEQVDSVMV